MLSAGTLLDLLGFGVLAIGFLLIPTGMGLAERHSLVAGGARDIVGVLRMTCFVSMGLLAIAAFVAARLEGAASQRQDVGATPARRGREETAAGIHASRQHATRQCVERRRQSPSTQRTRPDALISRRRTHRRFISNGRGRIPWKS